MPKRSGTGLRFVHAYQRDFHGEVIIGKQTFHVLIYFSEVVIFISSPCIFNMLFQMFTFNLTRSFYGFSGRHISLNKRVPAAGGV